MNPNIPPNNNPSQQLSSAVSVSPVTSSDPSASSNTALQTTQKVASAVDNVQGNSLYFMPVVITFLVFAMLFLLIIIVYTLLIRRSDNYTSNLTAMINDKQVTGVGNEASKNDPLDNVAPSVYLNKSLIPRVETKFKTESALRFTKQKSDIRSTIDGRKIKKYKDTGRYAPPCTNRVCWRVPRVVVYNDYFVEVLKTTRPQLKQRKSGKKGNEEEEEDMDTLSKGPPVLDMYASDDNSEKDSVYQRGKKVEKSSQRKQQKSSKSAKDNESIRLSSSSEGEKTDNQLVPAKDESSHEVAFGKGTGGKKRSYVRASVNQSMPKSGMQPERAVAEKRMPYFN
ncbi:uncharacterized protein LOC134846663 [Symsagittifera roscoffensis]|uniref:uncharacterized protein LOC134846663 n=1 Tax=Symsagittifera roscoffensis TaxID=84072 RepID=UPI00307C7BED